MSDPYAHFCLAPHAARDEISGELIAYPSTCALCVVNNLGRNRPMVTVYFPPPVYQRLKEGLPSLAQDSKGRWMVGSAQTTGDKLKRWLERYEAWDMVRDAETVVFGDSEKWKYYLARAS